MTQWLGHDDQRLKCVVVYNGSNSACLLRILDLQGALDSMSQLFERNTAAVAGKQVDLHVEGASVILFLRTLNERYP